MPRWTEAARAKQAALIRSWQPWQASTGPRTAAGKKKSSRNADRGGDAGRAQRLADAKSELAAALAKVQKLSKGHSTLTDVVSILAALHPSKP